MSTYYTTHKSTREGKRVTQERRTLRSLKYSGQSW